MAQRNEVYKCEACGNIVEVLHGGEGELVCCGEAMKKLAASTEDKGKEKHVPVKEQTGSDLTVKVGDVPHPMEEEHYIEWIEVLDGNTAYRQYLKPGQDPKAVFANLGTGATAREYCNVHGMWEG